MDIFGSSSALIINGAVLALVVGGFVLLAGAAVRRWGDKPALSALVLSLAWLCLVYAADAMANTVLLGRVETMFGDAHAPIGHGYGLVYPHGNWGEYTLQKEQSELIADPPLSEIRRLQVSYPYVVADADDTFKLFDLRSGRSQVFSREDDLARAARAAGIHFNLERAEAAFARYHDTWFDKAAPWLAASGIGLYLIWHVARLWRRRRPAEAP